MELYKPLGITAAVVLVLGLMLLVRKWPQGFHATFSQHAAAYWHTILYYNLLFTIVLPLLVLFFVGWFALYFELPPVFTICLVISAVAQYIVTIIPETGGWKTRWHRMITAISALLLLPALAVLLFAPALSFVGRLIVLVGLFVMLGILVFVVFVNGRYRYLLWLQASYYAAFLMPILLVAYAGL